MDQVGRLVEWVFAVGMNLEVYSGQCHWRGGGGGEGFMWKA